MLRQNQQNLRLISTHAIQDGVKQFPKDKRVSRPPEVHYVQVNRRGRYTDWESVKAIFTQQRARDDSHGHACERWLWISFSGSEPTEEELALEWPREKQAYVPRTLKDNMNYDFDPFYDVTEKTGENGRRFWRETFKRTSPGTFEETCRWWEAWMREKTLRRHLRERTLMERDW